jgi:hypothetical protein
MEGLKDGGMEGWRDEEIYPDCATAIYYFTGNFHIPDPLIPELRIPDFCWVKFSTE